MGARLTPRKADAWAARIERATAEVRRVRREAREVHGYAKGGDLSDTTTAMRALAKLEAECDEAADTLNRISARVHNRKAR